MKKSVSIIAAAAMAASLSIAGSMTSFAAEEAAAEPTVAAAEATEAATIAPTAAPVAEAPTAAAEAATAVAEAPTAAPATAAAPDVSQFAGNWKLQVANGNSTVDQDAKDNGTVVITSDGAFTYTDLTGSSVSGTIELGTEEIAGTTVQTVRLIVGGETLYGGYYNASAGTINIGNGGQARLIRDNGTPTATTPAATTAAAATTARPATTAKPATTVKAATTANSGSKTDSPKTGVAFPAAPLAGLTVAAAAVAFTLRKKED